MYEPKFKVGVNVIPRSWRLLVIDIDTPRRVEIEMKGLLLAEKRHVCILEVMNLTMLVVPHSELFLK